MRPVALVCRACGAPSKSEAAASIRCTYCGSETALDESLRQRLREHLARMQRAADRARCALREQILAQLLPALLFRARVYLYGSLAILFLAVPALMLIGMLPFAMLDSVGPDGQILLVAVGVVLLGVGLLAAVGAFPAGLFLAFREGKKADTAAARSAREVTAHAEATADTRCSQCGGHAEVVVIGQRATIPCPWCGAALAIHSVDAAQRAADAIALAQQKTSDEVLRRMRVKAGLPAQNRHRVRIPGFVLEGGVYAGSVQGVPVWIAFDIEEALDGGVHGRVEVDRGTRLPGTLWFVRREARDRHASLLESYGLRPPPEVATEPELDARFVVLADPGVDPMSVARLPGVAHVLASLSEHEGARFDPAGGSLWIMSRGLFTSGNRSAAHADTLVRAVAELGAT